MTFFLTSVGAGSSADLGGLEGADGHCQKLADAVGGGNHAWRAYLSTQADGDTPVIASATDPGTTLRDIGSRQTLATFTAIPSSRRATAIC